MPGAARALLLTACVFALVAPGAGREQQFVDGLAP
jgi:hypothetical protein